MGYDASRLTYYLPRPKNEHNEAQRRKANLDKVMLNFDNSVEAQVRKAQKVGEPLNGKNTSILPLKGPTKRA